MKVPLSLKPVLARSTALAMVFTIAILGNSGIAGGGAKSTAEKKRRKPAATPVPPKSQPQLITELKTLHLATPAVKDGQPLAKLVVPQGNAALLAVAEKIRQRVAERTGAKFPIVEANDGMDFRSPPETHLIAVGCFADNPLLRVLYYQFYTLVDRWYPGKGGYALHTVHDPWGTGKNVIVVGGSDAAGTATAADELLKLPCKDRSWVLPRLHQMRLSPKLVERPTSPKPCRDWPRLPVDWCYKIGWYGSDRITFAAVDYLWTGDLEAAQAYKRAILERGSGGQHLTSGAIPVMWDLMEEAPVFTDEERLLITNNILTFLRSPEGARYVELQNLRAAREPRNNHQTRAALAVYFGANYYWKHYRLPEARRWLDEVEKFWAPQLGSSKPQCDSHEQQFRATLENTATYALASGHMQFFIEGHAREAAERHLTVIRTRGGMIHLGDTDKIGQMGLGLLTKAAHFYKDGRYLYPMFALRNPICDDEFCRPFADDVKPVAPSDHVGLRWSPVDPLYYHWVSNKPSVPIDKCFDKLAFRGGWQHRDEYLILDGVSRGCHAFDDANNIVEVSANDRSFIVTYDSLLGNRYADHNVVTVVRDGMGTKAPDFARLNLAADLAAFAVSDTEVLDYACVDARRLILWSKGRWWLVVDRVQAKQKGNFKLCCRWRTHGKAELTEAGLSLVQAGKERFHIASPTPSQRSLRRDEEIVARYTSDYEHAEPGLNFYNQTISADLDSGQHRGFVNLLFADQEARPRQLTVETMGETAARITNRETGEATLVAVGDDGEGRIGKITWRGRLVCVSPGAILLAGGTDLSISGQTLLHSEQPISVELDLKSGRAVAVATSQTAIDLVGTRRRVEKGRTVLDVSGSPELTATVARAVSSLEPRPTTSEAATPIETLRPLWKADASGPVLALDVGDVDGDGGADVAFGTKGKTVGVLSAGGTRLWSHQARGAVGTVAIFDLDGDGKGEIYVGCGNMHVYRLSHEGKIGWKFRTDHGVATRMVAADADGDGKREIIAGCHPLSSSSRCWVLGPDGKCKSMWADEYWTSSLPAIQVGDLNGDGKPEVLNGSKKGVLYVHTLPSRKVLWRQDLGDTVTDLALVPAASGKGSDIIASSATGYVTRLAATGKRLWATALPDEVLCLTVLGQGSESRIVCGCDDGGVYVLRLDENILGRVETGGRVRCVAALKPDRAVAGSDDGFLYALRVP